MKQQAIQTGDQFKDANGEIYLVFARNFGESVMCRIDAESMILEMPVSQLRTMKHIGRSDMRHLIAGMTR
jgi:hypothetical protein